MKELVEKIKMFLIKDSGHETWEEFVNGQSLGECQYIVSIICKEFPEVTPCFGEIQTDDTYKDKYGKSQSKFTHHWCEINNIIFDFSKGTLADFINWDDIYEPEILEDSIYFNIGKFTGQTHEIN